MERRTVSSHYQPGTCHKGYSPKKKQSDAGITDPFPAEENSLPTMRGTSQPEQQRFSPDFWECKKCGTRFGPFSDVDILKAVSHKFLNLCRNPGLAEETEGINNKLSLKVTRLTHEIDQTLNQRQVEPEKTLSLILECAAEKYQVCQMGRLDHRTGNIQEKLKGHSEDREMDRQLFNQIIEKVILEPKGSVKLQLINEKII